MRKQDVFVVIENTKAWLSSDLSAPHHTILEQGTKFIGLKTIRAELGGTLLEILASDGETYYILGTQFNVSQTQMNEIKLRTACEVLLTIKQWATLNRSTALEVVNKTQSNDQKLAIIGAIRALDDLDLFISDLAKKLKVDKLYQTYTGEKK